MRGRRVISDPHRRKTLRDRQAVAPVAVPDHVVRHFIPREGIWELAGNPVCRWMIGDARRDQLSPLVPQIGQNKQQPKADGRHDQEVHRADALRMIAQKGLPGLRSP